MKWLFRTLLLELIQDLWNSVINIVENVSEINSVNSKINLYSIFLKVYSATVFFICGENPQNFNFKICKLFLFCKQLLQIKDIQGVNKGFCVLTVFKDEF